MLNGVAHGEKKTDGLDLSYRICSDFLSPSLFGYSNGTTYLNQPESAIAEWRIHYENTMCRETFFVQELPRLYKLMKFFSIDLLPSSYRDSKKFLENWMSDMASKADTAIDQKYRTSLRLGPADEPVVYETARTAINKDSPHLSERDKREEVASEMFDHICKLRSYLAPEVDVELTVQ
jgi:hypothetical protein